MSSTKTYDAGVKAYRETYWMPDYAPKSTDLLACFRIIPPGRYTGHELSLGSPDSKSGAN